MTTLAGLMGVYSYLSRFNVENAWKTKSKEQCDGGEAHVQTCFIVMAGLQSLSSSRIDRQTVPDGYTFG